MKLPIVLEDYLDETEQNPQTMTIAELLQEAEWILSQVEYGEWYDDYSGKDIASLKRFRTRLKKG